MDKWDSHFLDIAKLVSSRSKDPSTKVGSVLVRPDKTIQATGYNGFARGVSDRKEWYRDRDTKMSRVIHAEMNCLLTARDSAKGSTIYTWPFLPCDRCCVHILQSGIIRVVAKKASREREKRWKAAFEKTRQYCWELGVEVLEV